MNRNSIRRLPAVLYVSLAVSLLLPVAAQGQTDAVDVTDSFVKAGVVDVDHLLVQEISCIVVMRGAAPDRTTVEQAGRVAAALGYERIANLIQITRASDDAAIVRSAEGILGRSRALVGCKFQIDAVRGVLRLRGNVDREIQRDVAVGLLRKITGVKEVRSDLKVL